MTNRQMAPSKVNLSLHVTGRRDDGYHLLDSVVVFTDICDWITVERAKETTLTVVGPLAKGVPTDGSNLILKAAALFPDHCTTKITLHKHLPAAAGIGGGSADAAATLVQMATLWDLPVPDMDAVLSLGADVPICVQGQPLRMQGIGEQISVLTGLPNMGIVLVNPLHAVPTGPVFQALSRTDNPAIADQMYQPDTFVQWVTAQRNDLQPPAIKICPAIQDVLDALSATAPNLARMSGSGATCFGLYDDLATAQAAAKTIQSDHPDWWVRSGNVLG